MKSIMKWLAGIFLACSLILSFFTPFEKALTLNLLLLYFFVKQFMDSTSSPQNLPMDFPSHLPLDFFWAHLVQSSSWGYDCYSHSLILANSCV